MADTSYQPLVYKKQGGNELVVASGGTITAESGATIALESGSDLTHNGTSLIDEIAAMSGMDSTEFGYINGAVAGTGAASKCAVLGTDSSFKMGGSYSSPAALSNGYILKGYGSDSTDSGFTVATFFFVRGTGSTALFGHTSLVEGNSTGASYPKTLEGGQFMAGLLASSKLASRGGDATAGMYGAWLKVYSDTTSIVDSGAYTAPLWVDNQHYSNNFSGTEYTIFASTGGTIPDAFLGMVTSSSGWDAFIKIETGGAGAMLSDSDQSLVTQSGALKVITPGGTKWIPLYDHP